jgi:hypothetical protein
MPREQIWTAPMSCNCLPDHQEPGCRINLDNCPVHTPICTHNDLITIVADTGQRNYADCGTVVTPATEPKTHGYVIVETTHPYAQDDPRTQVYDIHVNDDLDEVRERAATKQSDAIGYGRKRDTYVVCQLVEVRNATT